MQAVRFETMIDASRHITIPRDVELPIGKAEVIILIEPPLLNIDVLDFAGVDADLSEAEAAQMLSLYQDRDNYWRPRDVTP